MLKKAILGVVSAAVLSTLVFGRDVVSYVKTCGSEFRQAVKQEVPIEFEIERAREMITNLVPDIRKCMHVIAEEEVGVEHLKAEITKADKELGKQQQEILALRRDVGAGRDTYQYAGRTYASHEVKRDLSQRFERFKTAEATASSKKQILGAREKSVTAAREKLDGMLSAKRDLEVQIEHLDARLKTLQAVQTATNVHIDDSQLTRAKKLIGDLNKQLDVAEKMLDADGHFTGLIPVDTSAQVPEDLATQIDEYFQPSNNKASAKQPEDPKVADLVK
jgi:chromosome segregation ATPase